MCLLLLHTVSTILCYYMYVVRLMLVPVRSQQPFLPGVDRGFLSLGLSNGSIVCIRSSACHSFRLAPNVHGNNDFQARICLLVSRGSMQNHVPLASSCSFAALVTYCLSTFCSYTLHKPILAEPTAPWFSNLQQTVCCWLYQQQ